MIKKRVELKKEIEAEVPAPTPLPKGLRCECGEPVAPGQNAVCVKHIRTN